MTEAVLVHLDGHAVGSFASANNTFSQLNTTTRYLIAVDNAQIEILSSAFSKHSFSYRTHNISSQGPLGDFTENVILVGIPSSGQGKFVSEIVKQTHVTQINVVSSDVTGFFAVDPTYSNKSFLIKSLTYSEASHILRMDKSQASFVPEFFNQSYLRNLYASQPRIILQSVNTFGLSKFDENSVTQILRDGNEEPITLIKSVAVQNAARCLHIENTEGLTSYEFLTKTMTSLGSSTLAQSFAFSASLDHIFVYFNENSQVNIDSQKVVQNVATVTLVGQTVSGALHLLESVLKDFEQSGKLFRIFSLDNKDSGLTFVVDPSIVPGMVSKIYQSLFEEHATDSRVFGRRYNEYSKNSQQPEKEISSYNSHANAWWKQKRSQLLDMAKENSPLFVINEQTLKDSLLSLKSALNSTITNIFYAIKANSNPTVLKIFEEAGVGFECVSPGELDLIFQLFPTISPSRVLFTPNFAPKNEYIYGFQKGVNVTVDNVYPLLEWGKEVFQGQKVFLRLDPGKGDGHHQFVRTAGKQSKFGISSNTLPKIAELSKEIDLHVVGLHAHLGSGILNSDAWLNTAKYLSSVAVRYFPEVKYLDLGGGLGVPYREEQTALDLHFVNESLVDFKKEMPQFELWLEPGRYLVAPSGVLLTTVTQLKEKEGVHYVGVNTGFNSLIRPVLYNSYHYIVNLTRLDDPLTTTVEVCGNICETGDVFGHNRRLPNTKEGDVLLLATTGAYGACMGSHYNLRNPASEVTI